MKCNAVVGSSEARREGGVEREGGEKRGREARMLGRREERGREEGGREKETRRIGLEGRESGGTIR